MKKTLLTIATMALILTGCKHKAELGSGIDLDNLDTTASPVDDFYQYACGGWMKNHPLPMRFLIRILTDHIIWGILSKTFRSLKKAWHPLKSYLNSGMRRMLMLTETTMLMPLIL